MSPARREAAHLALSADAETARQVGTGRGLPVVRAVTTVRMHRHGIEFFLSANGVWLADAVPPGYLAEHRPNP